MNFYKYFLVEYTATMGTKNQMIVRFASDKLTDFEKSIKITFV